MLRDAREADLDAIVRIYNASIPGRLATADTKPVSTDSRRAWYNDPSVALCRKLGFQTWGHLPRVAVLDGVDRDLLILGRRVP